MDLVESPKRTKTLTLSARVGGPVVLPRTWAQGRAWGANVLSWRAETSGLRRWQTEPGQRGHQGLAAAATTAVAATAADAAATPAAGAAC